jgi:hypothetical protein
MNAGKPFFERQTNRPDLATEEQTIDSLPPNQIPTPIIIIYRTQLRHNTQNHPLKKNNSTKKI